MLLFYMLNRWLAVPSQFIAYASQNHRNMRFTKVMLGDKDILRGFRIQRFVEELVEDVIGRNHEGGYFSVSLLYSTLYAYQNSHSCKDRINTL